MKIKKSDRVVVIYGKDRAKTGSVEKVIPKKNRVVIAGINIAKKHVKPSRNNPKGGIVDQAQPFDVSNVKLICPKCNKATRVGFRIINNEKKRICRKCHEIID